MFSVWFASVKFHLQAWVVVVVSLTMGYSRHIPQAKLPVKWPIHAPEGSIKGCNGMAIHYKLLDSEVENLLRMLSACDERLLEVIKATVKALIDTAPEK